jgi:hypothetical protein
MTRAQPRFTRALMAKDEVYPTVGALARAIEAIRLKQPRDHRGLALKPVTLSPRGAMYPAAAAVEVQSLDLEGNPHHLVGYAIIPGKVGNEAASVLRHALAAANTAHGGGELLVADPDAGREAQR